MDREKWRPVREFPDHYEISSLGRLRRLNPYRSNHGNAVRKPQIARNGYVVYMLSVANKLYLRTAHRMVADAFLGPIPDGRQVNHSDGDKTNCRLDNLEIVTNSENRVHAYRVLGVAPNRAKSGSENHNAKLTWEQVCAIRASYEGGRESYKSLSRRYSVAKQTIASIIKMRTRVSA